MSQNHALEIVHAELTKIANLTQNAKIKETLTNCANACKAHVDLDNANCDDAAYLLSKNGEITHILDEVIKSMSSLMASTNNSKVKEQLRVLLLRCNKCREYDVAINKFLQPRVSDAEELTRIFDELYKQLGFQRDEKRTIVLKNAIEVVKSVNKMFPEECEEVA